MKTLEEEAKDFCERTDEEIGEYWSCDYDELPLQMARFVQESKWVQAEKLKAQIDILYKVIDIKDTLNVKLTLESLKQQLKELEDDNSN